MHCDVGLWTTIILFGFSAAVFCRAEVKLDDEFKEGMTLTRGKQCLLAGRAKYKEKVTVTFRGRSASTVCNNLGRWTIAFDGGEPGGPYYPKSELLKHVWVSGEKHHWAAGDMWPISWATTTI